MPSTLRSVLIATALLTLRSTALPRPGVPSYSVVAVDGGEAEAASPTTVVQTVTDSESSQTTVSVTIEESPAPANPTIEPPKAAVTVHADASTVVVPGSRTTYTTTAVQSEMTTVISNRPTTIVKEGATVTIMSMVTPSTSYFDDGMWHTSYGVPLWPSAKPVNRHLNQSSEEEPCTTDPASHARNPRRAQLESI